jgi:lipopolysaccharide/colanic/teichoic acid biosynthesis glycosyltransferase
VLHGPRRAEGDFLAAGLPPGGENMLEQVFSRRAGLRLLRAVAVLAFDAMATTLGLYWAMRVTLDSEALAVHSVTGAIAPLLVTIRLVTVIAARLDRWSFTASGTLEGVRLVVAMLAAAIVFALACPRLPLPVYVLEFFLTTSLMAAFRFAPRVADEVFRTRLPWTVGTLMDHERPRRVLNVIVALLGLVAASPLLVLIAIGIKLTSRGPILYKQERIGLDVRRSRSLPNDPRRKRDLGGRPFMMFKFRTMRMDAESGTGAVWCAKRDPRVTPLGTFLRHCRLDELPQLVNVIAGDMNIVGPRPERPTIFADLRERIPSYALRQRARPGITGYAQVNLEYDASVEDVTNKLQYDLEYLNRQSVATDLAIMAKTLPVMLFRERMLSAQRRPESLLKRAE